MARPMPGCALAIGVGAADARGPGIAFSTSSDRFGDFLGEAEGDGERFGCFFFGVADSLAVAL